jgi:hypothetical protein
MSTSTVIHIIIDWFVKKKGEGSIVGVRGRSADVLREKKYFLFDSCKKACFSRPDLSSKNGKYVVFSN